MCEHHFIYVKKNILSNTGFLNYITLITLRYRPIFDCQVSRLYAEQFVIVGKNKTADVSVHGVRVTTVRRIFIVASLVYTLSVSWFACCFVFTRASWMNLHSRRTHRTCYNSLFCAAINSLTVTVAYLNSAVRLQLSHCIRSEWKKIAGVIGK